MLSEFKKKRNRLQSYTWLGLPLVVVAGWFYPKLGYLLLGCMVGAIGVAFYKGRAWCDWMCPRGSFYDLFIRKISMNRKIPAFFRKDSVRLFVLAVLIGVLGSQIYIHWGNADAIGLAMVMILTVTTIVGIILGVTYQQRIWCHICPMGTIANRMSEGKKPLNINEMCVDCKICSKVCPMQLKPYEYKESGVMGDNDCIKCSTCAVACPKNALTAA
ncbi:MAG TPA: 4Fe-4S binding protein [Nitrospiraceae bacterium]|nr:MAG: 4Fe-4S binding protein [Nitrospirae bacterium GWA2_46_11]OGW23518.1 MAG: 4Fe-4S binding protein [Nitrospirae bacterium GWB2_47_37]HAK87489.1 4Fe-4S binding protein [Nitrospiraceae bacterium]HCL81192.1 4Fe-4S binding protein [Nitrospiraceae bacterium]